MDGFRRICPVLALAFSLAFTCSAYAQKWREVSPGDRARLPGDLYESKDYRVQWWYFTGHLSDAAGREFGYEITFFAAGVQQRAFSSRFGVNAVYLSHFAVSDIAARRFYHFSAADAGAYGSAGAETGRLHVWVERNSLRGSAGKMHVKAAGGDVAIDLVLVPRKPYVLNGREGYSRKSETSPLIASLYVSMTDLQTMGTVRLGSTAFPVSGKSWFDRELSSRGLAANETGWDWFALQLDDGRQIMLTALRKKDGSLDAFSSGTFVYGNGTYRHLNRDDFAVRALARYTSPHTGTIYPATWEISIPSERLRLTVSPLMEDQEFTAPRALGGTYWEGACSIMGDARGRAYVELTGYGKENHDTDRER